MAPNGAGPRGYGYGDGRAISIGEVVVGGRRSELQLKGAGTTPFCRNADGRAVLRSSTREFLASEAMHHLRVPTTRALALVASRLDTVQRPWYAPNTSSTVPCRDAAGATSCAAWRDAGECERNVGFMRERCTKTCGRCDDAHLHGGDLHRAERCAITTRVATSFARVGHFELYGRRAKKGEAGALGDLEALARHVLKRDFVDVDDEDAPLQRRLLAMAEASAARLLTMAIEWIRVGYVQSNFNADNCLVSGVTVDYGPFGFIEAYDPTWAMWVGSARSTHFSFLNQHVAAGKNFAQFAKSLEPLLDTAGTRALRGIVRGYDARADAALAQMWRRKLGLAVWDSDASALLRELDRLLQLVPTDYTIFFRQLSAAAASAEAEAEEAMAEAALEAVRPAFHGAQPDESAWLRWLRRWFSTLSTQGVAPAAAGQSMLTENPKFVPREWMLAEAYNAAAAGNHTPVELLLELFRRPYDEQTEDEARYYRPAPLEARSQGGIGFMS